MVPRKRNAGAAKKVPALPASLLDEDNPADFHPFIERFAHVVDREGRGSNGDQRFHLDPCLGCRRNFGANFNAILAQPRSHINVRQRQRMTKRYPLRDRKSTRLNSSHV